MLVLSDDIKENASRTYIEFIETTGVYGAGNTGGYNAPNPTAVSQTYTRIGIQRRGETTVYYITPNIGLPSDVDTFKYRIDASQFGFGVGEKYEDDLYHIFYEVGVLGAFGAMPTITATQDSWVILKGSIKCCLTKTRLNLSVPAPDGCHCEDEAITTNTDMMNLMNGLCDLVKCDKLDKAKENLEFIQRYCECNCSDCE